MTFYTKNPKKFESATVPYRFCDGIYTEMDNDLARDNLENDLPAADRVQLRNWREI